MSRWFLSYHTPDQGLAERLKAAIERKDAALSVFFAPSSLRAGGAWTAQLAEELAEADAFILLLGEKGVGKWQVPEYDEALDRWVKSGRTFPVIVVLLEGLLALASLGALAACVVVAAIGAAIHRPLARVPENALRFVVGVMLSAFGLFWTGESLGVEWPGGDGAIFAFAALFPAVGLALVALLKPKPRWSRHDRADRQAADRSLRRR